MVYDVVLDFLGSYWWIILLGVFALVVIFFIGLHIFAFAFAHTFIRKLRKQSKSINLLLAQRRETALEIVKLALSHDLEISRDDIRGINRLERIDDFQSLPKEERDDRVLTFIHSTYNVIMQCNSSRKTSSDKNFEPLMDLFNGVEATYRQKVAKYNSDVLGYNYWIRIPGTRVMFKYILRFREKDLLV